MHKQAYRQYSVSISSGEMFVATTLASLFITYIHSFCQVQIESNLEIFRRPQKRQTERERKVKNQEPNFR